MKLTLEHRSRHWIRGYDDGEIRIGEHQLRQPSLVSAETIAAWDVNSEVTTDAIKPILEMKPEVVILGLADINRLPVAAIYAAFLERGIGFEVMELGAACRTFNVLVGEGRHAVLAVLLNPV